MKQITGHWILYGFRVRKSMKLIIKSLIFDTVAFVNISKFCQNKNQPCASFETIMNFTRLFVINARNFNPEDFDFPNVSQF